MLFDESISREKYEVLCEAGKVLLDDLFDAAAEVARTGKPEPLLDWLPAQFSQHYTPHFARRFFITAVSVAGALDLWDGVNTIVSCTADALAVHSLIEEAKVLVEVWADAEDRRPTEADLDFATFEDLLFPDTDYKLLFDPRLEGIEDTDTAEYHGMLLRFEDWFEPYAGSGWVHPYCRSDS